MRPLSGRNRSGAIVLVLTLHALTAAGAQLPGTPDASATPEQVAEFRARPCPAGLVRMPDSDIGKMQAGITHEQYWLAAATVDQMKNRPEYQAQFDAAVAQARAQAVSSGDAAEFERTVAAMRNDPAVSMRCRHGRSPGMPSAGPGAAGMAAMMPMAGMGGVPGMPGMTGMPGTNMQAMLTQNLTSSLSMMGPTAQLAALAAPIAVPLASKALGGMFSKKPKTPEQLAKDFEKNGELAVDGLKFSEGDAAPGGNDLATRLSTLTTALGTLEGTFLLYVQPEAAKDAEPDLALAAERAEHVLTQLRAAGLAGERIEMAKERPAHAKFGATAKPGQAKVYLIRKQP